MASRNKKGKLYSLFSANFDVTFFYKPGGEEGCYNDEFYYFVLDDAIFIKARFIDNAVLIIDSATSMTISIINKTYDKLVKCLKAVDDITILASSIGSGMEFIQACKANNVPVVECPEFLGYSEKFYNKYKCYARNDVTLYGYYLIALHEESYIRAKDGWGCTEIQTLPSGGFVSEDDAQEPIPNKTEQQEDVKQYDIKRSAITLNPVFPEKQDENIRSETYNEIIDAIMSKFQGLSMTEKDGPLVISMSSPNLSFTMSDTVFSKSSNTRTHMFRLFELRGNSLDCFKLINVLHDCAARFNNITSDLFVFTIGDIDTSGSDNNHAFSAIEGNPFCRVFTKNGEKSTYEII